MNRYVRACNESQSDSSSFHRTRTRRALLTSLSSLGIGTVVFQRAVADEASKVSALTLEQIRSSEWVAGIELTDEQRAVLQAELEKVRQEGQTIQALTVQYESLPAFRFDPEMADVDSVSRNLAPRVWLKAEMSSGSTAEAAKVDGSDLSWHSIRQLGALLRQRTITSVQLTEHCLKRLQDADSKLKCVVTLTRDLAMEQAEQADVELSMGMDRGPLHGIPWGAKDLVAVPRYPTTWGATQFRDQKFEKPATVYQKLTDAGAVLVAKLSLGALAMGDEWFGGQTKNPWNIEQGSSGSSAGSASAVAAGLIPFAIGSETLGSIISPSRRCGTAGLRPTFGRVSRAGCMALSWTMDKIGPIARSADDCGFVLQAIHGRDDADPTTVDRWFGWPRTVDLTTVRIGRVRNSRISESEQMAIDLLTQFGAALVDIELPREFAEWTLASMLDVEAACVFEPLTRSNQSEGLNAWPKIFQRSHFVSAVDFLHAQRVRFQLMRKMAEVFRNIDLYVGGGDLGITNLTGHPMIALPVMMQDVQPQPRPICCTLTGGLYDEATLLAVAKLIEDHAGILQKHPALDRE
ncbi:MAG: amidase [Planctomycetota bacterium]